MNSCLQLTHKQAEHNNKVVLPAWICEWLYEGCQFFFIKDKLIKIAQRWKLINKKASKSFWLKL